MKTPVSFIAAGLFALLPALGWAHHPMGGQVPGTFVQGLLSGLGHPIIGLDHAAFIVASGFLLAMARRGMWGIAALVAGSLVGAVLHLAGWSLAGGEGLVAVSVILVGGLVASRRAIQLPWLAGVLGVAGILHGHAYAESIIGAEAAPLGAYLAGFSLIQLAVAATGFFAHRRLIAKRESLVSPASSVLGSAVAGVGALFLMFAM
jgi:urease accessory protein